jgi:large subunit ribosomal protein L21
MMGVFYLTSSSPSVAHLCSGGGGKRRMEQPHMYAIIRTGGRQYRAEVGKTIDVERLPYEIDEAFEIDDVLLVGDGDSTVIGQPHVEGATVKATVVDQFRGKKVVVFKYRQRTNYRRRGGHRQHYTRIRIDDISV